MHLILASTSRYRRELLSRLGLPFEALAPEFVEAGPGEHADPAAMVTANALGKARSLTRRHPGALVLGSDQAAVVAGRVMGKPGSAERAVAQLLELAGREHELLTAVALVGPGFEESALEVSRLRVRPLTPEEARAYVERDQPLDCAGSYKSEALGVALFDYLRSDDPTAIIGLPLVAVCRLLRRCGIEPLTAPRS